MGGKRQKAKKFHRSLSSTSQGKEDSRSWTDFPFLTDGNTVNHVKRSRVMFVMRGLPGSGKSTIVRLLKDRYRKHVVTCSADDHFLQENGTYNFQQEGLPDAHAQCQERARAACTDGVRVVVIDNTHVRRWEMSHYLHLATQNSYIVVIVSPKTPWRYNPALLARKNKHGVPEETLELKLNKYEVVLPVYYGWFLNSSDSSGLLDRARNYFQLCLQHFPQFQTGVLEHTEDSFEVTFDTCYSREGASSVDILHCTAFFSNRGRTPYCEAYSSRDIVRRSLGQAFTLSIVGFVLTPRTCGARIALTPRQVRLWGKDDFEGTNGASSDGPTIVTDSPVHTAKRRGKRRSPVASQVTPMASTSSNSSPKSAVPSSSNVQSSHHKETGSKVKVSNSFAALMGSDSDTGSEDEAENDVPQVNAAEDATDDEAPKSDNDVTTGATDAQCLLDDADDVRSDADDAGFHSDEDETLAFEMNYVKLSDRPRFAPTQGLGSRAHITLGHARGASAVQTGLDQVQIIELEQQAECGGRRHVVETSDAALCCYDDAQCVVYLNEPIKMTSLFTGRY